jgi:hypothetical protein
MTRDNGRDGKSPAMSATAPREAALGNRSAWSCLRRAASRWGPAGWFLEDLPPESERKASTDRVSFTACGVVFDASCLDGLQEALQGRRDVLVFPRVEHVSAVLEPVDPVPDAGKGAPCMRAAEPAGMSPQERNRANGPLQVPHGDVAQACGCRGPLNACLKPLARSVGTHEDRACRLQLRLRAGRQE